MRALRLLAIFLGLLVAGSAFAASVGDPVKLPSVTLLDGKRMDAAAFSGKPTLVVFWASWCPYCAKHNPMVQKLIDQTKGTDLQVITVTIDKNLDDARKYLADKKYSFAATSDVAAMEAALGKKRALPKTYLIDRSGKLAVAEFGEMFEEDVLALKRFASAAK
ncbi:MAG: TlpA family protein disulfide reductase [Burkholderiaceae bacterium]